MVIGVVLYLAIEQAINTFAPGATNPMKYCLFLQYEQPNGKYLKGWADLVFVVYHVIFWSLCV